MDVFGPNQSTVHSLLATARRLGVDPQLIENAREAVVVRHDGPDTYYSLPEMYQKALLEAISRELRRQPERKVKVPGFLRP